MIQSGDQSQDVQAEKTVGTKCGWWRTPTASIYISFIIASWGDQMWHFALGVYLVHLDGGLLRLAAIHGLLHSAAILFFGSVIGRWVDTSPRLKVVRVTLLLQNGLVVLSAAGAAVLCYSQSSLSLWMERGGQAAVIFLALLAELTGVAYKIAIEKDWVVVIAQGSLDKLANLNAVIRSIDLFCLVLTPTLAGAIMSFASLLASALVIAAWNMASVIFGYILLKRVYRLIPRLHYKVDIKAESDRKHEENETLNECTEKNNDKSVKAAHISTPDGACGPLRLLVHGWRVYVRQEVLLAGLALAALYMTVIGFDSITLGYIYSQGISEFVVGITFALAGITGILGTFLFTKVRKCLGLERTGLVSFTAQITCIIVCVISIWMPGSPFEHSPFSPNNDTLICNASSYISEDAVFTSTMMTTTTTTTTTTSVTSPADVYDANGTNSWQFEELVQASAQTCSNTHTYFSVIMFLVGIVLYRTGLWMTDLVVTQLQQEHVSEVNRGVVNGVQNSLNMLMDVLKFSCVIVLPRINTFGYLILVSFTFVCLGAICYLGYVSFKRKRKFQAREVTGQEIQQMIELGKVQ